MTATETTETTAVECLWCGRRFDPAGGDHFCGLMRHKDQTPRVLDDSQRNRMPTGRVTVTAPEGYTDRDLAQVAGFGKHHHGVDVTRYDDGTALVSLWND